MTTDHQHILNFWFRDITPKSWWTKDDAFDERIKREFGAIHQAASRCELAAWRETAGGRLAEIIILDQFSRNMFRGQAAAFAQDSLALALTQEALRQETEKALNENERPFLLMPYMHSESQIIHRQAIEVFTKWAPGNLDFEHKHKAIIDRFGRYPHRNEALGRSSTKEELEFLQQPGSSF